MRSELDLVGLPLKEALALLPEDMTCRIVPTRGLREPAQSVWRIVRQRVVVADVLELIVARFPA